MQRHTRAGCGHTMYPSRTPRLVKSEPRACQGAKREGGGGREVGARMEVRMDVRMVVRMDVRLDG